MANVLESNGLFWWHRAHGLENDFDHSAAVSGYLTVNDQGVAALELHGLLSQDGKFLFEPTEYLGDDVCIQGILKGNPARVLLVDIRRDGGTAANVGISFDRFVARHCLVSQAVHEVTIPHPTNGFGSLAVDLSNLEDWIGIEKIEITKQDAGYAATVDAPTSCEFEALKGTGSIRHFVLPQTGSIFEGARKHFAMKQVSKLVLSGGPQPIEEHRERFGIIEDLLLLLTGLDITLEWPSLSGPDGVQWRHYFQRRKTVTTGVRWHECWIPFRATEERFGTLLDNLVQKREELGPGLYLYLGTRRARLLYPENRFVNLVWGLEALNRRINQRPVRTRLEDKIERILSAVIPSDRKWLTKRLANAHEPSLGERLFETLKDVPFGIERCALHVFCGKCSKMRNDISHFGGQRHDEDYNSFVSTLLSFSEAIEILYHGLLLQHIGVSDELLKNWLFNGPKSYGYRQALDAVGLKPGAI